MPQVHDLTGKRFGRLTVRNRNYDKVGGNARWNCDCDCGGSTVTTGYALEAGKTRSCGCLVSKKLAQYNKENCTKHNTFQIENDYMIMFDDKGNQCLIDQEDYAFLSKWYWRKTAPRRNKTTDGYWVTNAKQEDREQGYPSSIRLHQLVAEQKYGLYNKNKYMPDHLSRDHSDNRRCNIVLKENIDNAHNRGLSVTNTSGKTGVYKIKDTDKWSACITVNYKTVYLGRFDNYEDAVKTRKDAELKYGFTCDEVVPEYDLMSPAVNN